MYRLIKPLLFRLDPEKAHTLVQWIGGVVPRPLMAQLTKVHSPLLLAKIGEAEVKNPIGLAAGFDKNGEMVDFLACLGFGFLEIGSVTARECKGLTRPRIFRLPSDLSLINRMGLPNKGSKLIARALEGKTRKIPIGINIAKTPQFAVPGLSVGGIDDQLESLKEMHSLGAYFVFNLSCPNTDEDHTFEDPFLFQSLAREVFFLRKELEIERPILIKISPDLSHGDLHKIIETAIKFGFDGFVVSNTSPTRAGLATNKTELDQIGHGGISGAALRESANRQLKRVFEIVGQKKLIIGVGGVMSFNDLVVKFSLGAQLVQIYTGLIYNGPYFVSQLNKKLLALCKKEGVGHYSELIGRKDLSKASEGL